MTQILPVASFFVGVLLGAWLYHRARAGQSPLPTISLRKPKPDEKPASGVARGDIRISA